MSKTHSQGATESATVRFLSIERLAVVGVVLASALAMSPNVADPDLWGHVQFGRDALHSGHIAPTTSYSYTAEGFRWINHENLSEIILATVADTLGPLGLVLGKFLLSLLVVIIVLRWQLRNGVSLIVAGIVTLVMAANLGYHWSLRPQLSSFVGFTFLVWLLQFAFSGWRDRWHLRWPRRWFERDQVDPPRLLDGTRHDMRTALGYQSARLRLLWLAPLLFLIWANSHGGFVAGLSVYLAYVGLRGLEALSRGGLAGSGLVRRMLLMALVAILATMLNPYGPRLHIWLLESLGSPRPEISDWSNRELFTIVGMKLWFLVAMAVFALTLTRRKLDATQMLILGLTLWQSLSHFRHVPFFAILCGFWIGPHLESAIARVASSAPARPLSARARAGIRCALVAAIVLISIPLSNRLSDLQVYRDQFPVDAIDYMRQNDLHGRLVVTYDWAQYSIAALCSEQWSPEHQSRVAFDGRFRTCYPQSIVDMHFDFLYGHSPRVARHRSPSSPPCDPSRILNYRQPELVLLRRFGELTEQHMNLNQSDWILLYQDAIAQVWGVRHMYGDPHSPAYIPTDQRVIHNRRARDSVTWPAIFPHRPPALTMRSSIELADSKAPK